jgi:hypothetical protein
VRHDPDEGEGVRRIGRYILNGLTVLSLVLCTASAALWVRSHWRRDLIAWNLRDRWSAVSMGTGVGGAFFAHSQFLLVSAQRNLVYDSDEAEPYRARWCCCGFAYELVEGYLFRVYVPFWFIVLVTAIGPVLWWSKLRRRTVPAPGFDVPLSSAEKSKGSGVDNHALQIY